MQKLVLDATRKIGFTADPHYGHANILKYCKRPFLDAEAWEAIKAGQDFKVSTAAIDRHDTYLAEATNALLGADDILVIAGDLSMSGAKLREYRERLKVREVYVTVGNHDKYDDLVAVFGSLNVFERVLLEIVDEIRIGSRTIVVDHYPGDSWYGSHKGVWQLYGHVHGRFRDRHLENPKYALSTDVGVDQNDYRPILWGDLRSLLDGRRPSWNEWKEKVYVD